MRYREGKLASVDGGVHAFSARGFWDIGLNPTRPWRWV
jgi:hypothetical protein